MPNQIKTCPHRGNMKIIILVCSLTTLVQGSLEPAGYKPPGTNPQTGYLPPSSGNHYTDDRYVSPILDLPHHDIHDKIPKELPRSLSLPLPREPAPFSHYLPANRQTSDRNDYQSVIGREKNNQAKMNRRTLSHSTPSDSYLPPSRERSSFELHGTDRNYLISDGRSSGVESSVFGQNDFSSIAKRSRPNSVHRSSGADESSRGNPWDYAYRGRGADYSGYQDSSSDNQTPAKYEFAYEVKDDYGNDYGHKESRNGERTQGVYKVLLPDGRRQIVHYEADSHGYRPVITYEEAGSSTTRESTIFQNRGYQY